MNAHSEIETGLVPLVVIVVEVIPLEDLQMILITDEDLLAATVLVVRNIDVVARHATITIDMIVLLHEEDQEDQQMMDMDHPAHVMERTHTVSHHQEADLDHTMMVTQMDTEEVVAVVMVVDPHTMVHQLQEVVELLHLVDLMKAEVAAAAVDTNVQDTENLRLRKYHLNGDSTTM